MNSSYQPTSRSAHSKSNAPSSRYVYRHHLRDLQGAVGASIGKGFDVLSRQLGTLNRQEESRK